MRVRGLWAAACAVVVVGAGSVVVPAVASAQPLLPAGCAQVRTTVTCTYTLAGSPYTVTTPPAVGSVEIDVRGGTGGKGGGVTRNWGATGRGALIQGTLPGLTGRPLTIIVGGAGANGARNSGPKSVPGGAGYGRGGNGGSFTLNQQYTSGGAGGGATAIRDGATLLVVAGGGGGGGGSTFQGTGFGARGGDSGDFGTPASRCGDTLFGGAQPNVRTSRDGVGGQAVQSGGGAGAGGGGGGVVGGEGGRACGSTIGGGGGAGGTSLVPPGATLFDGAWAGDGQVIIRYTPV